MYKVLLVDDEVLIRQAISENIHWEEMGFELLAGCENGREAIRVIEETAPDLVLTDICMPYVDGIELARYVQEHCPGARTIIISGYDEFEYAKQAVRYQVMEYILKPITPTELTEVLLKAKAILDKEHSREQTFRKLRGAYRSNRPILRTRFLNSLLRGNEREEDLEEKMRELELTLEDSCLNTAIVEGDDLSPFLNQYAGVHEDLALFSIFNILQELIEQAGKGIVFQDQEERTVIIFQGKDSKSLEKEMDAGLQEARAKILELLQIETTAGVGVPVTRVMDLHYSFDKARAAAEMKWLLGGGQILHAETVAERETLGEVDVPQWAARVLAAIKEADEEGVEREVRAFAQEIREQRMTRNRAILLMQNLLLTVLNRANLNEKQENQLVEEEKSLMNRLYTYEHLRDMATDVIAICQSISRLLGERMDSYGKKQAMRAMDYIDQNYMNSDLNLNTMCSYLAMSTSYFSNLFKTHTGETFVEALTRRRMEAAKELLVTTTKRSYEIAEEVGYADPHYFSIAFKKATGQTPTEYAKERRGR